MSVLRIFCLLIAAVFTVDAQELAPELAPLAAKHRAETEALQSQKAAAIQHAQKPYLAALEAAERTATAQAQIPAVAAITKERESIASGAAQAAFPLDLPKSLQADRRAYFEAIGRIMADTAPRQGRVDADYLRALAQLQPRAAANPVLADQIKTEKERVLADAKATATGPAGNVANAVTGAHGKDVLTQKIGGSKWQMFGKKDFTDPKREVTFEADGKGSWGQSAEKWESIDGKSIKFRYGTVVFSDNWNTFTFVQGPITEYGKRKH